MKRMTLKLTALLLSVIMLFGTAPLSSFPETDFSMPAWIKTGLFSINTNAVTLADFQYSMNNEEVTITKYNGLGGMVVIPNTIDGYPVTSIRNNAFYDCKTLTSITMPDNLKNIGTSAFQGCISLTSITIPYGTTSISNFAFMGCISLISISLPNTLTNIGREAFWETPWYLNQPNGLVYAGKVAYKFKGQMPGNTTIELVSGSTGIAEGAFDNCTGLTNITIPEGLTNIGDSAFTACIGLKSVTIPLSVTNLGIQAFSRCRGLTNITIPENIQYIGDGAFLDCIKLTTINFNAENCTYFGQSEIKNVFSGCNMLTTVNIGTKVHRIPDYAFYGLSSLTSILLPDGLISIGERAFQNCSNLTTLTFGDTVKDIAKWALFNTGWYNAQPDGPVYAGKVFYKLKGNNSVSMAITIEEGTIGIAGGAFENCDGLTSVVIPNSVMYIGNIVFIGCNNVTIYGIPGSIAQTYANDNGIPFIISTEGLYLISPPFKTTYLLGEVLTFTGLSLIFVEAGGLTTTIDIIECVVSGYNPALLGKQTIAITYAGESVYYEVTVTLLYPESAHPYDNNVEETWEFIYPVLADSLEITFSSQTYVEEGWDFLYIFDGEGNQIGKYTGDELAGQTIQVPGNTFSVRLTSDRVETGYGFLIDAIVARIVNIILPAPDSNCVVDNQHGFIYGLPIGVSKTQFENLVQINGNYSIMYSSETLGTGTVVYIVGNTTKSTHIVVAVYNIVIFGDVNGDGSIDSIDASNIVDYENYMRNWNPVTDSAYLKAGDLNDDGSIDSSDAGIVVDVENYLLIIDQTTGVTG